MPRVVPAKTEPEDEFMSGLHHDPFPPSPDDSAIGRTRFYPVGAVAWGTQIWFRVREKVKTRAFAHDSR